MPRLVLLTLAVLAAISSPAVAESGDSPNRIGFNRDVRPILSDKCFRCHGPDAASRAADLRLDVREAVLAIRDGHAAVVPGKPEASELFKRITTADADTRMPPADSELVLTDAEREVLRRWIAEGAEYEPHWAFVPPQKASTTAVKDQDWVKNPIDAFVAARLEREKLSPSPEADSATLCRRLHLDLTGIPPTPAEVDEFVSAYAASPRPGVPTSSDDTETVRRGDAEKAYAALVDKLLASPRYGERMAGPWLDAARYADTNGYQTDGPRQMWRWRDWVIEAFNRNLRYDQFTLEQLAGDLLPSATLDQRIATGFNRNHRMNAEGGIIPEEFLVEYVVDRVETTATVWLGLTLGCARCHDHKYDPFSQRDFYRLFAFFNNVPEPGKAVRDDNSPPFIPAPTREQQARLQTIEAELAAARQRWNQLQPQIADAERKWVADSQRLFADWTITEGLIHRYRFDGNVDDDVVTVVPDPQLPPAEEQPRYAGGPFAEALVFDGTFDLRFAKPLEFNSEQPFSSSVWIKPEQPTATVYAAMDPDQSYIGVELRLIDGHVELILSNRILDDAIRVRTKAKLPLRQWSHVVWTYDGVKLAERVKLFVDGKAVETETLSDTLSNKFTATAAVQVGGGGTRDDFRGRLADLRFYDRQLAADEAAIVYCGLSVRAMVQEYEAEREPAVRIKLREYFLRFVADEQIQLARKRLQSAIAARDEFMKSVPTTMVMHEVPGLRETHVLKRGEYDKPGEPVTAGVPDALPVTLPSGATVDRLALARWLVDPRHPLTARVAVNRLWQQLFGIGLVKTVEDFGAQGEAPSHPELLDWLAVEFVERGWDVKQLLKLIVTSSTYRQSSHVTPQLRARDPENRLLARGARFRLSAEAVRDSALAVSGLLVEKLGGPSIKPYQPAGLWEELATGTVRYEQDHGDYLYRRGLYVYRKRAVAPPGLLTFDAAAREACVVRQTRTNTPLQALNLLNDVTFVEAARWLATRMYRDGGKTSDDQIAHGFRLTLGRNPTAAEAAILRKGYDRRLTEFRADRQAAAQLLQQGESPIDPKLDVVELAALTTVGNVLLNLDEFVTRP